MIKLKDLLNERVDIFSVDVVIISDRSTNFTDIVNGIRGIRKITTVNMATPEEWEQKNKRRTDDKEVHLANIKFIGSREPKQDLKFFKQTMMKSDSGDPNRKIQGLKGVIFREKTLRRI
jgi:hypothetical protein